MNYKEFMEIVKDLEERENGKLYDVNGRFRAYLNVQKCTVELTTRYFFEATESVHYCGEGWKPTKFTVFDRENKTVLGKFDTRAECYRFLSSNYPQYEDPLAYWS